MAESENINACIRIKPLLNNENEKICYKAKNNSVFLTKTKETYKFGINLLFMKNLIKR